MRTSLNEIQLTEEHLMQRLHGDEEFLFQAKLILNRKLAENVQFQSKSYHLVREYGRKRLKEELEAVHQKLFSEDEYRSFRQKVLSLFGTK